jgi:hypothetical protein
MEPPKGYRPIEGARVYASNGEVIVTHCCLDEVLTEQECEEHNCDHMGCGWEHVLWRLPLPEKALAR